MGLPGAIIGDREVDELYLGDLDGFVQRRDILAKERRTRGDREAADAVRALKKPSRPAWAANQVSGRRPELREELLAAGTALREAQQRLVAGEGDAAELREAGERERAAVTRAAEAAETLAREQGTPLSAVAAERARQTLHAVALEDEVRREFAAHRLVREHETAGLGGLKLGVAAPAPRRRGKKGREEQGEDTRRAERRRRRELQAADAEVKTLEAREQRAREELQAAQERAERAQHELERAQNEAQEASARAASARQQRDSLRAAESSPSR